MAKRKINENYIHECNSQKVELEKYASSLANAYSDADFVKVIKFYLLNAPVISNDSKKKDRFGLKKLRDYGWVGNNLNKLERELIKTAELGMICCMRCESIDNTLEEMDLHEVICIEHPRAVIKQLYNLTAHENGEISKSDGESRMLCLFRHIRNSIAHSTTYVFPNGFILLEDRDIQGNKITARILIKSSTLVDWISVIDKDSNNSGSDNHVY